MGVLLYIMQQKEACVRLLGCFSRKEVCLTEFEYVTFVITSLHLWSCFCKRITFTIFRKGPAISTPKGVLIALKVSKKMRI